MALLFDFRCQTCDQVFESSFKHGNPNPDCSCGGATTRLMAAPKVFSTIIPDYPGSKKKKAGYVHSHADRPKTEGRIQVGWTGKGASK